MNMDITVLKLSLQTVKGWTHIFMDKKYADFSTFSLADLQVFYDTAYDITTQFNANMRRAIIGGFIEGVTPIIEIALFEVGGPVALKLLKKIPVSWVLRGTRLNNMVKKVGLLGEKSAVGNHIRIVTTSSPFSKSKEMFNTITKHAISKTTQSNGSIVANMGNGNFITFRPITASSSGFKGTIELNFKNIWSKNRIIKFK